MGSATSNTVKIKQNISNDFLTINDNNCVAYNGNSISGNVVNFGGDLSDSEFFNISGTISAACTINQQITQTITSILTSQSDQVAKTSSDFMNGFTLFKGAFNSFNTNQTVTNNITQISSNTCNATIKSDVTSNVMNVAGNGKNIKAFNINTNQTATCTINNTVDQEAYNAVQAKVQQEAKTTSTFVALAAVIAIAIVVCSVATALIYGVTGIGKIAAAKKAEQQPPQYNPYGPPYQGGYQGGYQSPQYQGDYPGYQGGYQGEYQAPQYQGEYSGSY